MGNKRVRTSGAAIEQQILALLKVGPIRQCEIADHFPAEWYIEVGHAVRRLETQCLIERERTGLTYIVRPNALPESAINRL